MPSHYTGVEESMADDFVFKLPEKFDGAGQDKPVGAHIDGGNITVVYASAPGAYEDAEVIEIGSKGSKVGVGKLSNRLQWVECSEFGLWIGPLNVLSRDHAKTLPQKLSFDAVAHGLGQYERAHPSVGFDAQLTRLRHYWKMYYQYREALGAALMIHLGHLADFYEVQPPQLIQHFHDTQGAMVLNLGERVDEEYVIRVVDKAREFAEVFKGVARLQDAGLAAGCARMNRPQRPRTLILGGDTEGTDLKIESYFEGETFLVNQEKDGSFQARIAKRQGAFEQSAETISEAVDIILMEHQKAQPPKQLGQNGL